MRRTLLGLVMIAGCGGPEYVPDAIPVPDGARARRGECVDVQIRQTRDEAAVPGWPVIVYRVGNRCRSPVRVDLAAARVEAASPAGRVALRLHDPRSEVVPASLDGRSELEEALAYEVPRDAAIDRICVGLGGLANGLSAEPVCLDREVSAP